MKDKPEKDLDMIDDCLDLDLDEDEDDGSAQAPAQPQSPTSLRQSSALPSEPATEEDRDLYDSDTGSAGGYSPPAWRRLGNGDRSSGFWKRKQKQLQSQRRGRRRGGNADDIDPDADDKGDSESPVTRETSPDSDDSEDLDLDDDDIDGVLQQAIRTRLPRGSESPLKHMSPAPEEANKDTSARPGPAATKETSSRSTPEAASSRASPAPENCMLAPLRHPVCLYLFDS